VNDDAANIARLLAMGRHHPVMSTRLRGPSAEA
jgi:hypothetical protein